MTATQPDIAVVVMAYGLRPTLAGAVRSLQTQGCAAEIVVVHSGPGDAAAYFAAHGVDVRVVSAAGRLYPGGARNQGIAATSAPVVAFLADDCHATPGWIAARLKAHGSGARAVASALLSHRPHRPVALAAHLSLFIRRMPLTPPDLALCYGASYARELFARYGLFRDDMEGGEDTEFHQRLAPEDAPVWCPAVQTIHHGEERLGAYLRDQSRRGRRMAEAWRAIGTRTSRDVARNALRRTTFIISQSRTVARDHRLTRLMALPLIVAGNVCYAWGALRANRTS
ncbi:MAG: glycosyltransferase family A protein [Micropepsaceae bacterium]